MMPHSRTLVTAPAAEPVTLSEVKDQMRITHSDEDTFLNELITTARVYSENYTSRALVSQTWDCWLDAFPPGTEAIKLPLAPLISVTSVKYYDSNDTLQTWSSANYTVDTDHLVGSIYPGRNTSYPSPRIYPKAVEIRFVAGYADSGASPVDLADNVPTPIKAAIKMLVAHWYENRETTVPGINVNQLPFGYVAALAPYKLQAF